jgi:chemotaxis signal transduction protein
LLVFSVGGQQVAARTEEIAGVRPWPETMPVPSDTPFVTGLVRLEKDCMPVYDLAARLNRMIDPATALCLIVKHEDGPMAICIDPSIPSLHMADTASIHEQTGGDSDIAGTCSIGEERLSIIRLARLGKGPLAR